MKFQIIFMFFFLAITITAQTKYPNINKEIDEGNFEKASKLINDLLLKGNLPIDEVFQLEFEIERMKRIRLDFQKSTEAVLSYIKKYYPDADEEFIKKFEEDNSLEHMYIDGDKYYFNRSHTNLFRINKEAKDQKEKVDGKQVDGLYVFLENYVKEIVQKYEKNKSRLLSPVKLKLNYTLTVDKDAVPDGEIIRCWMPWPREGHSRQTDIKLLSANSKEYIIADNSHQQRTIYMEQKASAGENTVFNFKVSYVASAEYFDLKLENILPYNTSSEHYKLFTSELAPHIQFTDQIKKLSKEIVEDETNPYLISKRIFTWINNNIPWAGAREYSTLRNIPEYCLKNMHGDCGIKTLLFLTLCRYNGIPAKWQSGWMLHPGEINLHDWGEIYFEGYGWVPVDQSFGLIESDNEDEKYFFLGGMDAYRLISNDDYSQSLFPAKIFPRSETVDFQRGEVEWKGGNLYFNQWDYKMKVEYIE